MNKLSDFRTSFRRIFKSKFRKFSNKIKRKFKRKISDAIDVASLNFHNIQKHNLALTRYKRYAVINSAKKNQRDRLSITQAYSTFSYAIIILVISWTFLNALSIYKGQRESFGERIEIQKAIIEKNFSNSISLVDNFSSYVGDKILLFGTKDKKAIATILKKNNTSDSILRNIYSWLDVDYVNNDGKLIVTSKHGILEKAEKVPPYYPINQSLKKKWVFKIGKVALIKSVYGDYQIIPVAFSIDDDDSKPQGTLISRIIIQKINDDIKRTIEEGNVSYIILSRNFDFIAYSNNDVILKDEKKKSLIRQKLTENKELKALFNDYTEFSITKDGVLKEPINIGNTSYQSFRKSDYPFIILTSYSKKVMWKFFQDRMESVLFQSIAITLLFLSTLFVFKRIQIVPIIKQLINSREKAEEASKAKSDFLSTISHELRTPMNGIIGMSQILSESKNLNDEEWDQVKTINKSANSLLSILNDILNFSKIEAQKVELENIDFNFYLLLENIVDIMSPAAMKKDLEIFINIDKDIPRILVGDSMRIRQVITNLVNNAIKFTHKGQIFIEVLLERNIRNKYIIRFNIKDSGIGIKKADLGNLFKKFTQADMSTTRKYGGTGLGLSICKELVRLMDGKIGIESRVGIGSNFWFTVQLSKSNDQVTPYKIKEREQLKGKKVLIIDSNQISSVIEKSKLELLFEMEADIAPIEDLDNFTQNNLDKIVNQIPKEIYGSIIINNNKSKNFNAITLAKKIKEIKELANLPLTIVISSYEKGKLLKEELKLFSSIIIKPLKESALIESMLDAYNISYEKDKRYLSENNLKNIQDQEHKPQKILMCEDNMTNIKVAMAVLKRMGHNVEVAQDGKEGFDKIFGGEEVRKYDMIFMDCMMPVMDGFTATKKIRKEERERNMEQTPIIALTANISQSDKDKCFKAGMDDFLSKPIQKELVEKIIDKWTKDKS